MPLYIPENYTNILGTVQNTEKAVKSVKDMFQDNLSAQLALLRVTAPMVVLSGTGINDDLNSVERPVRFPVKDLGDRPAEVVHSLAKWKRLKLADMGIRVDCEAMRRQLAIRGQEDKAELYFHKRLLAGELPYTIGGGVGQSRLCMFLLKKAHIGEIQSSIWSEEDRRKCAEAGIVLA